MIKIRKGQALQLGIFDITPVEKVEISGYGASGGFSVSVRNEPVGIIVSSGGTEWAIDIDGNKISKDQLLKR